MNPAQMMAHCNVAYDMTYNADKYSKPGFMMKLMMKFFVKDIVVGSKPYQKNSRTAPEFMITEDKDFEVEKAKLINNINKTQELGATYFENKESRTFGSLSSAQWNTMFSKHLEHHLTQFGV